MLTSVGHYGKPPGQVAVYGVAMLIARNYETKHFVLDRRAAMPPAMFW